MQKANTPILAPSRLRNTLSMGVFVAVALIGGLTPALSAQADSTPVMTSNDPALGTILTDSNGMSLYLFTEDTPGVSNCSGGCLKFWPPLIGTPSLAPGITGTVGSITRTDDGTQQVTYNGWPLYYYSKDENPGDTLGQDVTNNWFAINPGGPSVATRTDPALGTILTDATGATLYMYARDTVGTTSSCTDTCANNWPAFATSGAPMPASSLPGTLAIAPRDDGTEQMTYNGSPLYYYAQDQNPGDTKGQGVGSVWSVVSLTTSTTPPASSSPAPAAPQPSPTLSGM